VTAAEAGRTVIRPMGVVYAMNARTGKLIWKTPVGEHSKSDSYPREALEHKLKLKAPYTILPGGLGGCCPTWPWPVTPCTWLPSTCGSLWPS
jgi:hypothetical protein